MLFEDQGRVIDHNQINWFVHNGLGIITLEIL